MSGPYNRPRLLEATDQLGDFDCGSDEQTAWLRDHARQAHAIGTARVLVVTPPGSPLVAAYYGWAMATVAHDDAPARLRKGAGRYPQPVALLARLGVDVRHTGRGLGAALVRDALLRVVDLGHAIGCRGLLVHAADDAAREFYLHLVPGFERSPTDPLHLVVLTKDIERALRLA